MPRPHRGWHPLREGNGVNKLSLNLCRLQPRLAGVVEASAFWRGRSGCVYRAKHKSGSRSASGRVCSTQQHVLFGPGGAPSSACSRTGLGPSNWLAHLPACGPYPAAHNRLPRRSIAVPLLGGAMGLGANGLFRRSHIGGSHSNQRHLIRTRLCAPSATRSGRRNCPRGPFLAD